MDFRACVFRSFHDGSISRGVATETIYCLNKGIPVLELIDIDINGLDRIRVARAISMDEIQRRELTIAETRSMLASIKQSPALNGIGGPNHEYSPI
jgi:hypothetical protein